MMCERCGGIFVERTNRTTGKTFWGCSNFPNCRGLSGNTPNMKSFNRKNQSKKLLGPYDDLDDDVMYGF